MNIDIVQNGVDKVKESAGVALMAMGLDAMKQEAAGLDKLMQSAEVMLEPLSGQNVNLLV